MSTPLTRVLVVDNSEPLRRAILEILRGNLDLGIIFEALDGVEAIELAQELQPELILLGIRLPKLNGIEVTRKIRELLPQSKILVVSQEDSVDIVQAVFSAGALGYVVKADVGRELVTAVKAVLNGKRFVGPKFAGHGFTGPSDAPVPEN